MQLHVNGSDYSVAPEWRDAPLLWTLREALGIYGPKFGCGVGVCGACVIHINGAAQRACQIETRAAEGQSIVTIEGLAAGAALHPVQQAWIDESVPQCGYCQAGQIMMASALWAQTPRPSLEQAEDAMNDVLCRCGTQPRIRRALTKLFAQG